MSGRLLILLSLLLALCASTSFDCWFLENLICPILCSGYAVHRCFHNTCYCAYPNRNSGFS